ncbi:MAG: hypothetical protein K2P79_03160 [Sphingomonas sp.]|nr:hypothetical protein [Sphingomonas sp.]
MTVAPVLVLLGIAALLGVFMGYRYLRGERNSQTLAGVHLLFGAGGLELLVMLLRGSPSGATVARHAMGSTVALIIAGALLTGLFVPIIAQSRPGIVGGSLAAHATAASIGFGLLLLWALGAIG